MIARILDNKVIALENMTEPEERILIRDFSAKDPRAYYINTGYDGVVRVYKKGTSILSRALLGELRKICNKEGLSLSIIDDRPAPEYPAPDPSVVTPDLLPGITLEEYQIRAIKAACSAEVGYVESTTGSGKTEIMAGICKIMDCPTVMICDQTIAVTQIAKRLELRDFDSIGMFMAGVRPNGQKVLVGSVQSLSIPKAPKRKTLENGSKEPLEKFNIRLKSHYTRIKNCKFLREQIRDCDLLLIDEADRATNKYFKHLIWDIFNGRRRYGFSGTIFNPAKPHKNLLLKHNLGSIIARAGRQEVQERGRIIPIEYNSIVFGNPYGKNNKMALDIAENEYIINNPQFHRFIKLITEMEANKDGAGVLVLVGSIPFGLQLESIIDPALNPTMIYGDTSKRNRMIAIEKFEKRESKVLIGSDIVKRAMDLKGGCQTLIMTAGGQDWSEFNQMIGRALRVNEQGHGKVYDIFHVSNFYLYKHSRKRLEHAVHAGYPSKVIFPKVTVDAVSLIKSRYHFPVGAFG